VVQLWGWPGSGKAAIARSFAKQQGAKAAWLGTAQLSSGEGEWPQAPWLLAEFAGQISLDFGYLGAQLRQGQKLLLIGEEHCGLSRTHLGVITPQELLLTVAEVTMLLVASGEGEPVDEGVVSQIHAATDGWYAPLRRVLKKSAGPASEMADGASELLYDFFERRLLALLPDDEMETLLELSLIDSLSVEIWSQVWSDAPGRVASWEALRQRWNLFIEPVRPASARLPRLLAQACRRRLEQGWPASRVAEKCRQLALVCYGQDRPEAALTALLLVGDYERASELAQLSWLAVWSSVRVSVVRQVVEHASSTSNPAFAFLRWSLAAIDGELGTARAGLEGLAARQRSHPLIAAVAALALAALDPTPAAATARMARQELNRRGEKQRGELRTLLQWVEFGHLNAVDATEMHSLAGRLAEQRRCQLRPTLTPGGATGGAPRNAVTDSSRNGFEVQLLGVPRVVKLTEGEASALGGEEIQWSLRRSFLIFAFLASAQDGRANREAIVEAAWPAADERRLERNFHPTLSHLRRALRSSPKEPSCLEFINGVYQLNPRIDWRIDCLEFSRLAQEGRRQAEAGHDEEAVIAYESAWRLYRGPLLEGFYESWVEERREALSALHLDSLRRLGELQLVVGNAERATDCFRAVLTIDPLQEGVHLSIMRIYGEQGRRDLVRKQYDRLTQMLRDELLVEPMDETNSEYHRLMS